MQRDNYRRWLAQIRPHVHLVRHATQGIARVEDGTSGTASSCHPNIDRTGSVRAMKQRGWWDRDARIVYAFGFAYNTSQVSIRSEDDRLAALTCNCGGACRQYQESVGFTITRNTRDGEMALIKLAALQQGEFEALHPNLKPRQPVTS